MRPGGRPRAPLAAALAPLLLLLLIPRAASRAPTAAAAQVPPALKAAKAAVQPPAAADPGPAAGAAADAAPSIYDEAPEGIRNPVEGAVRSALLEGYDASSYPWKESGAANVSMNIAFNKVLSVDLYAGQMSVSVWFRMRWNDPRLVWDPNVTGVPYVYFENSQPDQVEIWTPDVTLWNAANDMSSTLGLKRPKVDANGDVFWTRNGLMDVSCNFRGLEAFPFGKVVCDMELGSWVMDASRMDLYTFGDGASIGGSITGGEGARHVEYTPISVTFRRHVYGDCAFPPCRDEWPVILYTIVLSRASVLYTFKILLPQIVLTMVAFSTFWLSPECGERLGLAITVPLAVAVYDLLVFNSLPTSNRISFVSAMGLLAFLFSIAVLVANAIVIQLWYYREPTYFQSITNIANTMLSFREQSVWVEVIKVMQELKQELARRQHDVLMSQTASARLKRTSSCKPRTSFGLPLGALGRKDASPAPVKPSPAHCDASGPPPSPLAPSRRRRSPPRPRGRRWATRAAPRPRPRSPAGPTPHPTAWPTRPGTKTARRRLPRSGAPPPRAAAGGT
ncbi:MAG: neurotransmitter-gated ion-channel ligand-binding domain-containing protein [Monoraphidium minutum]|nr:MAG: neurotransmitter-gated ion-channel ligand-binding domain-containing protein [Monoraphidium minutum]